MMQQTFLVEIGTEELPPKALRSLGEALASQLSTQLAAISLSHGEISWFATPRRLAVKVASLSATQPDREVEKRGPAVVQAYDAEGKPTQAAEGWARSCGIAITDAKRLVTSQGEWLFYRSRVAGQPAAVLLADAVNNALAKLPIAKLMRWGNNDCQFVRPVRTVTLLLGETLIPGVVMGIHSDRVILGHRFMGTAQLILKNADQYPQILSEQGHVIADYLLRKEMIKRDIVHMAEKLGGVADINESLLEEVTALVEWPVVLTANFEEKFLAVPPEALVYTMKVDQRYFPVYDAAGKLMPHFIFVANIASKDPQQVISGNEKVVRPRLADAEFFFTMDRKMRLEEYLPRLENVVFQQHLGTLRDKTGRLQQLAGWVAGQTGVEVTQVMRAGLLSKCDLVTSMVFEFPETQGVMGMHYARLDGEAEEVALALNEQYLPRFSGDALPSIAVSRTLAIADKIDTLTGLIGSGQHPKGDKDPFALRRAALGVLRIIIECNLLLDLHIMVKEAVRLYNSTLTNPQVVDDVVAFMLGRLRVWYQEKGYHTDTLQAVLARHPVSPADFDARVKAVTYFRTLDESTILAAADRRVANMLLQCTDTLYDEVNLALLTQPAEVTLMAELTALREALEPLFTQRRYQDALIRLATLRKAVDDFFTHVLVMDKDDAIRVNRLTLLGQLRALFLRVADFSVLQ